MNYFVFHGDDAKMIRVAIDRSIKILYGLSLLLCLFYCYMQASNFNSYPYDGPFQTLYSLRKISNGVLPGRDFYFFHGNGIPYIHYPLYAILGKGLFASYFAEAFVHVLCVLGSIQLIVWYFSTEKMAMLAVIAWVMISALDFFGLAAVTSLSVFQPLSTFGIRSISPIIAGLLIASMLKTLNIKNKTESKTLILVLITPLFFLLGTEHGIYTLCCTYLALMYLYIKKTNFIKGVSLGLAVAAISMAWMVIFHLIFFGNLSAFVELRNLVNDQTWYYGVYPHLFTINLSEYILSEHVQYRVYRLYIMSGVLVLGLFWISIKKNILDQYHIVFIVFIFFESIVGLTSNLGYVSAHYGAPLLRVYFLVVFMIFSGMYYQYVESVKE